ERNQKKAFELFSELSKSKSYEQNSAKYYLASCYENGEGVTKDVNKACQLHLDLSKSESDYQVHFFRWLANYYKNKDEDEYSHKYCKLYFKIDKNSSFNWKL
ncbi:207_t:CDS:1, partial [Gigaspora margarita]